MAGEKRTQSDTLSILRALEQSPHRFDFFQALRNLECFFSEYPRIGTSNRPQDDPVRFGQYPDMAFAASSLYSLSCPKESMPARLSVLFFGLFGPNGPLPHHLTELARNRMRNAGDLALVRFADMFHHRFISLFYRAWAEIEPTVNLDRPGEDRFSFMLGALTGIGMESMRMRDEMPDYCKLYFTGRLGPQARNSEGLTAIIGHYFGIRVKILQFIGQWMDIPERFHLKVNGTSKLGLNTHLGARVWDCQYKFRLVFGPLSIEQFENFLPGKHGLNVLAAIVRNYIGDELDWDVQLLIDKKDIRPVVLGDGSRLGMTCWLFMSNVQDSATRIIVKPLLCPRVKEKNHD